MPTYNLALTTGAYPNLAGTSSSNPLIITAGATVTLNLSMANAANFTGSKGISLNNNVHAGTFSNQGTPNGIYQHQFIAPSSSYAGNNLPSLNFFARHNGAVIGSQPAGTLESGRLHWQVQAVAGQNHGSVTGVSAATTETETPVITVSVSGTTNTEQVGWSYTSNGTITWSPTGLTLTGPTRGGWATGGAGTVKNSTFYFWVRSAEYTSNTSYASPVAFTPPFLPTDITISRNTSYHANSSATQPDITTSNGTWIFYIDSSSVTGTYNNYAAVAANGNVLLDTSGNKITSGVNGFAINNTNASNTPSSGTTQFYIWGSRTKTTGGNGGQGFPAGFEQTNLSFFVENGISPTVTNSSGSWFDATSSAIDTNNTDNALRTRANFTGLSTSRYYVVARQDSSNAYEEASPWSTGSASVAKTFTDPLAAIDTQRTYKLYSNTSESFSGATEELSFTRTRIDPVVTEPTGITIDIGVSSYTVTLTGTVAGLIYYIKDGEGTSPTTGGSATATGTTTTITVNHSSCLPANVDDTSTTVYVWAQSLLNWYSTLSYPTGDSIVVTRSDGSTGSTTISQTSSDFGLIVYAQNGTDRLVDTTSRIGRIVASSSVSGVLGSDYNDTTNTTFNNLHPSFGFQSWVWNYREDATVWRYTPASGGAAIDVNDAPTSGAATVSNGGNLITGLSAFVGIPGFNTDTTTWQVLVEVEAFASNGSNASTKTNHRVIYYDAGDPGTVGSYGGFRVENFFNFRPQDSELTRHKYHYIVIRSR